jgi:hypothetical protein
LLIGVAWVLLRVVILVAGVFAVKGTGPAATAGILAGTAAALVASCRARDWLMRMRLRRLRAKGVTAKAVVVKCDWDMSIGCGLAIAKYAVLVRWVDPVTGVVRQGDRRYRFVGMGSERFRAACSHGAIVRVHYPPNRPSRFVIDVPFAPVMADIAP